MVKTGSPVSLIATARDDGSPRPRPMFPTRAGISGRPAPDSAPGCVSRGSSTAWRGRCPSTHPRSRNGSTRAGANAPMAPGWVTPEPPVDNQWVVRTTFAKPGTYILSCQTHDGAVPVAQDVTFVVNP